MLAFFSVKTSPEGLWLLVALRRVQQVPLCDFCGGGLTVDPGRDGRILPNDEVTMVDGQPVSGMAELRNLLLGPQRSLYHILTG